MSLKSSSLSSSSPGSGSGSSDEASGTTSHDSSTNTTTTTRTSNSVWSDVPKRLVTVCVGIPFVYTLLSYRITSYLFFMGAHALSVWEYTSLEPTTTTTASVADTVVATADADATATTTTTEGKIDDTREEEKEKKQQQQQQQQIEKKKKRFLFCIISLLLAFIPDSHSHYDYGYDSTTTISGTTMMSPMLVSFSIFLVSFVGCGIYVTCGSGSGSTPMCRSTTTTNNYYHWMIGFLFITLPFRAWCNLVLINNNNNNNNNDVDSTSSSSSSSFASTLSVLLVVWNADTGALIVGRLIGRRRRKGLTTSTNNCNHNKSDDDDTTTTTTSTISYHSMTSTSRSNVPNWIHQISPAKTMEGFMGGMVGGIITAMWGIPFLLSTFSILDPTNSITDTSSFSSSPSSTSFTCSENDAAFCQLWGLNNANNDSGDATNNDDNHYHFNDTGLGNRFWLGFLLSLFAIIGDLIESSMKRKSHSKDSGSILPGHGGILDRFDSSLLSILVYRFLLDCYSSKYYSTKFIVDGNHENNIENRNEL